jgi:hypothetical protein
MLIIGAVVFNISFGILSVSLVVVIVSFVLSIVKKTALSRQFCRTQPSVFLTPASVLPSQSSVLPSSASVFLTPALVFLTFFSKKWVLATAFPPPQYGV